MFNVSDEVHIVAGDYMGLQGYIVQKTDEIFDICQSGMQEQIESFMVTQTYVKPPPESKSIKIIRHWMGKSGVMQWVANGVIWFQDELDLMRHDTASDLAPSFIKVNARMEVATTSDVIISNINRTTSDSAEARQAIVDITNAICNYKMQHTPSPIPIQELITNHTIQPCRERAPSSEKVKMWIEEHPAGLYDPAPSSPMITIANLHPPMTLSIAPRYVSVSALGPTTSC
ncbi:hypothetical protein BDR04DRAFT_1118337 [Suillus decipiens]|nr:hypothetical protein BDR04DRAFT_1118337 [Suillus decipiens]